jgi:hypothetical protein
MTRIQIVAMTGAALGAGAGLFSLGQAAAAGISPETAVPGLLAMAFSAIGVWGSIQLTKQATRFLRALLGAAIGGLVAVDLLFIPAGLLLAVAGFLVWRD